MTLLISLLLQLGQIAQVGKPTPPVPDKDACIVAHEKAQVYARQAGLLRAARRQLLVCRSSACPTLIREDCSEWLPQVEKRLEPKRRSERPVVVDPDPSASAVEAAAGGSTGSRLDPLSSRSSDGVEPAPARAAEGSDPPPRSVSPVVPVATELETPAPPPPPVTEPRRSPSLRILEPEAPRTKGASRSWTGPIVFGALSGLSFGFAGFMGAEALGRARSLKDSCAPHCGDDQTSQVRWRLRTADAALVSGVVCAGVSAWLLWHGTGVEDGGGRLGDGPFATATPTSLDFGYVSRF